MIQGKNPAIVASALDNIVESLDTLRRLSVVRSRKWVADYGEWLVAAAFCGTIAESKTQTGWDVRTATERIQVKTHSKAFDNPNRWSAVNPNTAAYDALAIVVLNEQFRVTEFYKVPSLALKGMLAGNRVRWADCARWRLRFSDLRLAPEFAALFQKSDSE